jgi:DNA-directed RNA polymerase subunit F
MSFACEKCDLVFKSNYELIRHVNKKIPCNNEEKEAYVLTKRTCLYCEVLYADVKGANKHMKICPLRPSEAEELKQIIAQLSNKISEQSNKITIQNDKLTEQNDKLNDMSQQMKEIKPIIIQNNIQNNITVTPFGKEDLSFLTLKDYTRILNKGCYSVPELLKLIHCNDSKPEYRNVYIKNFKDEYMFTFDGQDWGVERKDDVFANMIENKKNFLERKLDDMSKELPKYAIKMFHKFLEQSDDNEVIANIKDDLRSLFYKNRNHVVKITNMKTKKMKELTNEIFTPDANNIEVEKKPKKKNIK